MILQQVKDYQLYQPFAFSLTIATTNPTATHDRDHYYAIGSQWFNKMSGDFFVCNANTNGAATWIKTTLS